MGTHLVAGLSSGHNAGGQLGRWLVVLMARYSVGP
jgi:hypothetical protein